MLSCSTGCSQDMSGRNIHVVINIHVGNNIINSLLTYNYFFLNVHVCFALFVCLTLLASFFLPSHLSFKNMIYIHVLMRDEKEGRKTQSR